MTSIMEEKIIFYCSQVSIKNLFGFFKKYNPYILIDCVELYTCEKYSVNELRLMT